MTQPRFAPIPLEDEVRPGYRLEPPKPWTPHRPADYRAGAFPRTTGSGVPGPDQGYALRLARRFDERLELAPGEHADDVIAGAVSLALRRAARFGRAPVITDIELVLTLFGYLGDAPRELVERRRGLFQGASHDYWQRRALAHLVPDATLQLTPAEVRGRLADWSDLIGA
ncbi:MAG TPA: hypothetical protein VMU75_04180 [Acidimicrobiales bacterium]|nr:hypothetical protein [Acidimicrobiales bacterium]